MQGWIPDISAASGPKYLAIAQTLARDIDAGVLAPGDRLLPQRALAEALGVDLTTITRAYGEAQRLGLIEGSGRRGSFVRERRLALRSEAPVRMDPGMNAPPEVPGEGLADAFGKSAAALLGSADGGAFFQYQPGGGMPLARAAGANLLKRRGIEAQEDTVLVSAGGQHGLHAIFSAQLRPGDLLAVPSVVYPGLLALARRYGVPLRAVHADNEGLDPEALEVACNREAIRAVYIVPTNDNPTTATLGVDRRDALARVARRHGLMVIEDDAYGLLPEVPLPPVATFAPELTWHIASVSKILSPGLRVAWLRAPDVGKAWRLGADMHETAIMAPPLNAAVVADWLSSGTFDRLVGQVRAESRTRQDLVRQCLPAGSYAAHPEGYHLWLRLAADAEPAQVAQAVASLGISAIPSEAFAVERGSGEPALRVSIGGAVPRDRLKRGLQLLAALTSPEASRKMSLV